MGSLYKAKDRNFPKCLTHDLVKNIENFSWFVIFVLPKKALK